MRRFARLLLVLWSASASVSATASMNESASGQTSSESDRGLALVGGTIYPDPDAEPIADGVVLIRGGSIVAVGSSQSVEIPESVPRVHCAGLTVTAGFWNSHVHFFERKWASAETIPAAELTRQLEDALTRFGFTSVFDTGSVWTNTRTIRDRIDSGEVDGPRIRSTGEALIAKGAMPSDRILAVLGFTSLPSPEIVDVEDASEAVDGLLASSVDAIKVHLQPPPEPHPPFPLGAIEGVARRAHDSNKPVFVHPHTGDDVLAAIRAGVDVIAHTTPASGPWDDAIVTAVRTANVALTPTLHLWKSAMRHDRLSVQQRLVSQAVQQLRVWIDAGGTVLFGTDLGAVVEDPSEEYTLMAQAGMSFRQILASLTTAPAEAFGDVERGTVAPGMAADLTVFSGEPARHGEARYAVRYTIRSGRILYDSMRRQR